MGGDLGTFSRLRISRLPGIRAHEPPVDIKGIPAGTNGSRLLKIRLFVDPDSE